MVGVARRAAGSALLGLALYLAVSLCRSLNEPGSPRAVAWADQKWSHRASSLNSKQLRRIASLTNVERMWDHELRPMLRERVPGSLGSKAVQEHITGRLKLLAAGWNIEMDSFSERTPQGTKQFSNIVATLDPKAKRRLVFACHYDSKYFPASDDGRVFIGATDSAVPCAMLLDMAYNLDDYLKKTKESEGPTRADVTLQFIFFDGEEAFHEWTQTDSLYGSRHLAKKMTRVGHPAGDPDTTQIHAIDMFVLLDLIGAVNPVFVSHFENTEYWFKRLMSIERRLHGLGHLEDHPYELHYFHNHHKSWPVQDDHLPFLQHGVPVLHLISTPFPHVWHTLDDNEENLHRPTINNLNKILHVFVTEYLKFL
ncbi:unnamed protein product [Lampetra fluviatilis]